MTGVTIPPECLRTIGDLAERAYPAECCGLLVGCRDVDSDEVRITRIVPSINLLAEETPRRFEVDPALRFRLMRELLGGPEEIVGHYHSHPDGPAVPSARDAEMAFEPDLLWVIVSAGAGGATETAAYFPLPEGGGFSRAPLL